MKIYGDLKSRCED